MNDKKLREYYLYIWKFQIQLDHIRQAIKYCNLKLGIPCSIIVGDKQMILKGSGINILKLMEEETIDIINKRRKWFNKKYRNDYKCK